MKKHFMLSREHRWRRSPFVVALLAVSLQAGAQQVLSLDSCRAMALRNNKQMNASELKQDVAKNLRKSARTKYLPHVSAIGTYQFTSEEISILNNEQKSALTGLGDSYTGLAALLGMPTSTGTSMLLNAGGQKIADAFKTDTRHIWAGSVMAVQPVFMGGSIVAMNKMADLSEEMARNTVDSKRQEIIYSVDKTYWQVVSLKNKKRLAESYLDVVKKLESDVQRMIEEGVATKSDGLSVSVKVNEAEMTVQQVNDGLVLSRMLLCQMVGLPMNEPVTLADEDADNLRVATYQARPDVATAIENRPELKMLDNTVAISKQATKILKAGNLPMVALTGGYAISNPNVLNGFERKFGGFWNVGVLVRVPIWNWGDVMYKVRASKGATAIASLELEEAREKIELQVNQNVYRVDEAQKRLAMANASVKKADENLRMANLGFSEGVATPTTVMEAQTAWLQAKSQQIDAEINMKLSQVDLEKSLGTLKY